MTPLTPEIKACLDEWRAELKVMCDEMHDTRRRPLTGLVAESQPPAPTATMPLVVAPAVSIDTSAVVPAPCVSAPLASSGTTEIIVASAGLAEPRPPAPTTTTLLVGACGSSSSPASPATGTTLTAVVDLFPVLAVAAASDGNLDGQSTGGVASAPAATGSIGGPVHDSGGDIPESVSPTPWDVNPSSTITPQLAPTPSCWRFPVLELGTVMPIKCLRKCSVEAFELTVSGSAQGSSPTSQASDSITESPLSWLAGMLETGFRATPEWAWMFHAQSRPPDSLGCAGGLFSPSRSCIPAPAPKPPWILLGHEKVTGHGHPALVLIGALHMIEETPPHVIFKKGTGSLCMQWKPPWPSFRLICRGGVVSHPILERFQHRNSDGLMEVTELYMPPFVGISIQQGSAFLDTSFGPESSTTGIPIQIFDKCSVLKILWSTTAPSFLMTVFLEETKLLNTSLLNCRTSTNCVLYHPAQFELKVAEPYYHRPDYCSAQIGLQVYVTYEDHKNHIYIKLPGSNSGQEKINLKVEEIWHLVVTSTTSDAFPDGGKEHAREPLFNRDLGGVAFRPSSHHEKDLARHLCNKCALAPMTKILFEVWFTCVLPVCTGMSILKSDGNGELTQWLIRDLVSECFSSCIYASALSSINRPSWSSKLGHQVVTALFFWVCAELDGEVNLQWSIPWDRGGCRFVLCNSQNCWTTTELIHLHCPEEFQWTSVFCARASRIWLVAWDVDDLQFSTGYGQAPFQGGRDVIRAAFFGKIHVSHHYYTAFINQILFSYDYYLNQPYYFDKVCSIIYYDDDSQGDSSKTMEVHMPWDPGKKKSLSIYHLKSRLGDKLSFKEGGMLGPSPVASLIVLIWDQDYGLGPGHN